jgi:hypothetical protein
MRIIHNSNWGGSQSNGLKPVRCGVAVAPDVPSDLLGHGG